MMESRNSIVTDQPRLISPAAHRVYKKTILKLHLQLQGALLTLDSHSAEYDPPGYLYQSTDLSGQMLEYATLPGTSRINGTVRGNVINKGHLNGCLHLHHKVPNGLNGIVNGGNGIYPGHTNARTDYDHAHHLGNVSVYIC